MWVQIHDLPKGFMSELVEKQLGDFYGEFMQYDAKNNSIIWMKYMRIKIKLDVRKPLKRKKKIKRRDGSEFKVSANMNVLGIFVLYADLCLTQILQEISRSQKYRNTKGVGRVATSTVEEGGKPKSKQVAERRERW